jgi:hypothetical protein
VRILRGEHLTVVVKTREGDERLTNLAGSTKWNGRAGCAVRKRTNTDERVWAEDGHARG